MPYPKSLVSEIFFQAIETQSKEKANQFVDLLFDNTLSIELNQRKISENKERLNEHEMTLRELIQTVQNGFERMDQRFDDLIHQMDKRFEDLTHQMDKRFESVDKRFDDVNKRFDDINKRFGQLTWLISLIFIAMNLTIIVLKLFS